MLRPNCKNHNGMQPHYTCERVSSIEQKGPDMNQQLAKMAASNNADWYTMMFDIHNLQYRITSLAFIALDPPPPFHSSITTLEPHAQDELEQLIKQDATGGAVKDAFDCLNLSAHNLSLIHI